MGTLEIRELEAFLVLAEELHFGRAGERLFVSQSRVSQLLKSLEARIGAPLVERTSRRVRLTPLGQTFLSSLRPAYEALRATVEETRAAARGTGGVLRIGFQGTIDDQLAGAVALFEERRPACAVEVAEIALSDPFGPVRRQEVDCAVVLLPVAEDDLVLGPVFSRQLRVLALPARHPYASRASLSVEELADVRLIGVRGDAPDYWRHAQAPRRTPDGRPIPAGPLVNTLQEGLSLAAAGRGAMLLCRSSAEYHGSGRSSLAFVPVEGLPGSLLGLVLRRASSSPQARAFAQALAETLTEPPHGLRPSRKDAGSPGTSPLTVTP
ncbi:LysR family transcriptional regulator [Streptomyces fumanus]|uniref:LysR family transcriptional regulator n=1 Tax=Streptomyces fumanus TaxID=67302 RepID=A0A919A9W1_9ACTN|nr:LysR family transcriptional regulator [Streptomyces fumanus]GHE92899.1 LysR family transcriptional regulator [Streptomyces fumanus]